MSEVIISPGQNLLDILLREQGTMENLFSVASDNGISVTEDCQAGTVITIESLENEVTNYYDLKNVDPATNYVNLQGGGINYMGIELDFKIS